MIARRNRFHGRASIQRVYKNGASARSGLLALRYTKNPKRDAYRLAVVVSRKVSKSSVVRNRIRRRTYEHVRILYGSSLGPLDLVVLVYDEKVATLSPTELDHELAKLFRKAKLATTDTN